MKFPSGSRPKAWIGLCSLIGLMALALAPATASADVTPTVSQTFGSMVPGAHGSYTNTQTFTYNAGTYPNTEDLAKWVIDPPAGLVGNPNAIPYDDRCTLAEFNTTVGGSPPFGNGCPASSVVGSAAVTYKLDSDGTDYDANGGLPGVAAPGTIYILQTDPDVPTTLATFFYLANARTQSEIAPLTSGDFRLRTVPEADITPTAGIHIHQIVQTLNANAPNGNPFLTNPTRCSDWTGYSYGRAVTANSNADSDPEQTGSNNAKVSAPHSPTPPPDCSVLPAFSPQSSEVFSTVKRDTAPVVTFNVVDPAVPGVSVPKTVVTTFPQTLSVNGAALPLLCSTAERDAHTCPASSKVGTVRVETALISSPLTGDVFAVQSPNQVPDLTVHVKDPRAGGLDFWIGSTSQLVNSQVITTFDNLPQVGFNKFALTIDAGTTGFLKIRKCPDSAARPPDGPIQYQMTSYAGQSATVNNKVTFAECIGINKLPKPKQCVHHSLNVDPVYASRKNMSKAELFIDGHRVNTNKKDPFEWHWNVDDVDAGKHQMKVRAFYKSGKKAYKKASWKHC